MKLVLLRHGESEWNLENRFTGWTDVDLSDNGRKEALSAGKALLDGGYDFDICYTSYLKRAIHTLDAVLDVMDRAWLPVIKSYKLNERHYESVGVSASVKMRFSGSGSIKTAEVLPLLSV